MNGVEDFWWNSQDVERADEEALGATHWVEDAQSPMDGREQAGQGLVPREVPFLPGHAENRTHKSDDETEAFWRHAQGVHESHALAHSPRRGALASGFSESVRIGPGNPAVARAAMMGESQSLEEEEEEEDETEEEEKEGTGAYCILMVVFQHHCLLRVGSHHLDMAHVACFAVLLARIDSAC